MAESGDKSSNISKDIYQKLSRTIYLIGAPNYWYEALEVPECVKKSHDYIARFIDVLVFIFLASTMVSFFTQNNLNEKQKTDRVVVGFGLSFLYIFVPVVTYHRKKVRDVGYNVLIKMKEYYNDIEVEKHMVKQAKVYMFVFGIFTFFTLFFFGLTGIVQVINGKTFVTIVTAWPDVDDTSRAAGVVRVIAYFMCYVTVWRSYSTAYTVVIGMPIILSHQYKNLCSYFYSLENIFKTNNLSQEEKEKKYEEAFKIGINMHSNTLRCMKLTQEICNIVFSSQLMLNDIVVLFLLIQMVNSERTLVNAATTATMMICTLISTGCLWWNAGDVTVEASHLSMAMFHSGWQHCQKGAALRVRPMLVISMWQSQRPVEMRCLSVVSLSYQSYVAVVRFTYSIFSVMY